MANVWAFLQEERGLTEDTLKRFGVDVLDDGGVKYTYPKGNKSRFHKGDERIFTSPKGVVLGLYGWHEKEAKTAFLVEGETDTMRLWQETEGVTVLGIPGINGWQDNYGDQFKYYEHVYVIFDNDDDYKAAGQADKTWGWIRRSLGKKAKRIYLPDEVKDVCEFFDKYDINALRMLSERQQTVWHYQALDLTSDPKPPQWLVQDLICQGDLTMMIGEPGVGKSWLSMSLAVTIAEGHSKWLGRSTKGATGRVLYVDEENPEALVPYRLKKLGLTEEGAKNIRYLHRQGVRLDRHPERILDEALDWEPSLIVLDSLTRLHTKDENHAGEVAGLFNDGVVPLARETGATTLLLHHVTKGESNSSFTRARGSGDLSASIDSGLDIRASDTTGGLNVVHYKSRWIAEGQLIRAALVDTPDGGVAIIVNDRNVF